MAEKLAAAKAIRGLANLYRDMEAAAGALEAIGSLEQAAEEAKKTVIGEQNKAVEARKDLTAVLEQLQMTQAQVDTLRNQAISDANSIVEEGKNQARLEIAAAKEEAASIVAGANTEAGEILAKAEEKKLTVESAIELLSGNLNDINSNIKEAREELRQLEGKIAQVRGEMAKMLG